MIRMALVGAGWRARFYLEAASQMRDRLQICCLVNHNPAKAIELGSRYGIPGLADWEEARMYQPDCYILCLPKDILPEYILRITAKGYPVLAETWLGKSVQEMEAFYRRVRSDLVQVAEQYAYQPMHAARLQVLKSGLIGKARQAQLSVAHGYHGIALMRNYLGIGFENCEIESRNMTMRAVKGPGRQGWPAALEWAEENQELHLFRFADRWAMLDFTGEQYFSPIRGSRVLIRGELGEIEQNQVRYLSIPDNESEPEPIEFELHRIYGGLDNSLTCPRTSRITGNGSIYYKNPLGAVRLSDEELAVAQAMLHMCEYLETGVSKYSLEEELQDQYLTLLSAQAIATGEKVQSKKQIWSR